MAGSPLSDMLTPTYKVLLLGDTAVGKTCLLTRFCEGEFQRSFISTIGIDFKDKYLTVDKERVKLKIWDTAGQERFRTLTAGYYRGSHGIILLYDVTNQETFSNLSYWLSNIEKMAPEGIAKILVGNKVDLEEDRKVSYEKGKELADRYKVDYFDTSCKTGENVEAVFESITKDMHKKFQDYMISQITPTSTTVSEEEKPKGWFSNCPC